MTNSSHRSPFRRRKALIRLLAIAGLCCSSAVFAQTTTTVIVDVCRGKASVTGQQQDGNDVKLDVEVAITGCDGVCTGSLEYVLRMTAADNRETMVHLTENWHWREVKEPFTLAVTPDVAPGLVLQEVVSMQIGRCSCSTGQITSKL
ncbi:MAG: hypothetical protein ACO3PV_10015 [Pseudohongiellaceae bacterium]